jgi:hypothetical protein
MNTDTDRTMRIDTRLSAYETFFDKAWAKELFDLTRGTVIDEPAFDLAASWKAVANTHRMPMTMMMVLESIWKGAFAGRSVATKHLVLLHQQICREVPGLTVTKQQQLLRAIQRLIRKAEEAEEEVGDCFPGEGLWNGFVNSKDGIEFQLGVWGSQRLCYPALYHAYENFVRDVMSVRMGDPKYHIPHYKEFLKQATNHLGVAIVGECLTDPQVNLARLVRNAFAHKGGKMTKQLRELPQIPFIIENDVIQIMAPDTTNLFNVLKDRVVRLAEVAIATPATTAGQ